MANMLGLERGVLKLIPYCDAWQSEFEREKDRILQLVGDHINDIQHVGSTAICVAKMVAKPILDIATRVDDLESVEESIRPLEKTGYMYRGEQGIEDRHLFAKGKPVTIHLHMMIEGCSNWERQIYFRDYLLEHPSEAIAYAELKKRLYSQWPNSRKAYSAGKGPFIERILAKAREKYGSV